MGLICQVHKLRKLTEKEINWTDVFTKGNWICTLTYSKKISGLDGSTGKFYQKFKGGIILILQIWKVSQKIEEEGRLNQLILWG